VPGPRLAVVGHVEWVDFIPLEHVPRPGEVVHAHGAFARAAGGGGVVAVVLAELGAQVDFYCALGADAHGWAAAAQLGERGVRVHVAWRDGEPTRRAVTMLEATGERTIVTIGERLEPSGSDALDWEALAQMAAVYFTAGDAEAFAHARRAGAVVASPRGRRALEHADGRPVDALIFSAGDVDEARWARRLAARCRLLVQTRGARGGVWWGESEGSWQASSLPGAPRDSYGCGDSFAAGFTFALAQGASVAQAAALGAECGARCLTRAGAP
jgi:ribokinase